ncbi:MAG TPA: hypothetical protein VGL04_08040 [Sporichthyaceae bacterium]|jgi:hypothetical protein
MDLVKVLQAQWDRAAAIASTIAGAILLIFGWYHVSDTGFVSKQLPYIASEGLGGVFLLGMGGMLWLSADLRDQWRELRAMRHRLDATGEPITPVAAGAGR